MPCSWETATIVVNAVGLERAADWFEASRRAERRVQEVEPAPTYQFGFAACLADALDIYGQEPTVRETAAWGAVKGARELARHGVGTPFSTAPWRRASAAACLAVNGLQRPRGFSRYQPCCPRATDEIRCLRETWPASGGLPRLGVKAPR